MGPNDPYELTLSNDSLVVSSPSRTAKCDWREGLDPEWTGEDLFDVFGKDFIYPPSIIPDLFEHVWSSWRDGELDSKQVQSELTVIADWINETTKAMPQTEFWKGYF